MFRLRSFMSPETFIERWQDGEGGQERANYALFLTELCDLIGVARPQPAGATHEHNDYVFERAVKQQHDGSDATTIPPNQALSSGRRTPDAPPPSQPGISEK